MKAYRAKDGSGKMVFDLSKGFADTEILLDCGGCTGCRVNKRKHLTQRCMHELAMHDQSSFITNTYAPEHLPPDQGVHLYDVQRFVKNLRQINQRAGRPPLRYFAAAEYGKSDQLNPFTGKPDIGRPHYHLLIFGFMPEDRKPHRLGSKGDTLFTSETVARAWGKGHVEIGEVTKASAGYCTGYAMKKFNGESFDDHYKIIHPGTGEILQRNREFATWSNKPGIGGTWFDKYATDTFKGFLTDGTGKKAGISKYYERRFEKLAEENPDIYPIWEKYKEKKREAVDPDHPDNTPERLAVQEECLKERIKRGSRYSI